MINLREWLEPEEAIGKRWHRLVGSAASWPRHPQAAVDLAVLKAPLAVFFRGLGGDAGVAIAGATAATSRHRLNVRLRLGLGEERLVQPSRDQSALYLPPRLDVFPDRALNEALYFWLAAYFVHAVRRPPAPAADPLHRDLLFLRQARAATASALAANPGLRSLHTRLCTALRPLRSERRLPTLEAAVEACVQTMLGADTDGGPLRPILLGTAAIESMTAPRGHHPGRGDDVPRWKGAPNRGRARVSREAARRRSGGTARLAGTEPFRKDPDADRAVEHQPRGRRR